MLTRVRRTEWLVFALAAIGVIAVVAAAIGGVGWNSVALEIGAGLVLSAFFVWIDRQLRRDVDEEFDRVEQDIDRRINEAVGALGEVAKATTDRRRQADDDLFAAFEADPSPGTLWPIIQRVDGLRRPSVMQFRHGDYASFALRSRDEFSVLVGIGQSPTGARHPNYRNGQFVWTDDMTFDGFVDALYRSWTPTGMYPGDEEFTRFVDEDLLDGILSQLRSQLDEVARGPTTSTDA